MRVGFLAIALGCVGCLSLPERPGPEDGCRDGQEIHSTFVMSPTLDDICLPWGNGYGNTTASDEGSRLRLIPRDDMSNSGGCRAMGASNFDDRGVFIEVPTIEPAASGKTAMLLDDGSVLIIARIGKLFFLSESGGDIYAETSYDPVAMRWWRMRPDRDANVAVADYSPNGFDWTELGRSDDPPPQTYDLKLEVGVDDVEPTPGFGEFDNLNTCVF